MSGSSPSDAHSGRNADWSGAISRARTNAPFLSQLLDRFPELAEMLARGEGEKALAHAKAQGGADADASQSEVGRALRQERYAIALVLAIGDLAGGFPLAKVMAELSALADRSLDTAIKTAIVRRVSDFDPSGQVTGMVALALGKQGAGELNYSSDIDPILLYDPETLPRRARDEPAEAAQRYAREVVQLLSENTAEGFVFRVDLRLRPASEVSPLAISLGAATTHYESLALTWERAAFIRARACAGDLAAGEAFLDTISGFIWRRSLDFGAIDEIRGLSKRIRQQHDGPRQIGAGFDVKQGRGGIREIEFFAQTHQLIHGGRDPSLRERGTRAALDALAKAQIIAADDASILGHSYDRLRMVEHRLQMVEDRQTHILPEGDALEAVAKLDGLKDSAALIADLDQVCAPVRERYGALIAESEDAALDEPLAMLAGELEVSQPDGLEKRIRNWSDGRYKSLRSEAALTAFDAIRAQLLGAVAASPDPQMALSRWEKLLERLPNAINFFRLLEARPALSQLLLNCLTIAPPLADELARRPDLLDALIDNTAFELPGTVATIAADMRPLNAGNGAASDDYEKQLDRIRIVTGEERFAMGMQLVEAAQDPLEVSAGLSRVAEAAIAVALEGAEAEFAAKHGRIAGSELIVLGLGRLGGGALTHASDLDLIFLYTEGDGKARESDGERALSKALYFNRLAQRVSAALSVPTAEGALYEVDTRLRPQGLQGPLAVGLKSFAKYQQEAAWTWEHMALTRARVLAGPDDARAELGEIIQSVLRKPRDADKLLSGIVSMRGEMALHKPAKGALDAKLLRGGLVDLEFLIHFYQLRDGIGLKPDLKYALRDLIDADVFADCDSEDLVAAHNLLSRILVGARLLAPDLSMPDGRAAEVLARLAGQDDNKSLLQALSKARQTIAQQWSRVFGETLDI